MILLMPQCVWCGYAIYLMSNPIVAIYYDLCISVVLTKQLGNIITNVAGRSSVYDIVTYTTFHHGIFSSSQYNYNFLQDV